MIYDPDPKERIFPVTKSYLSREIQRGAKEAGLRRIRVHDLRHSHVSLLIHMGYSPVAIAKRVGHKSIDITFPGWLCETVNGEDILERGFYTYVLTGGEYVLVARLENGENGAYYDDVDFTHAGGNSWTLDGHAVSSDVVIVDCTDELLSETPDIAELWDLYSDDDDDVEVRLAYTMLDNKVNYIYVVTEGWGHTIDVTLSEDLAEAGWTFVNGKTSMTYNDVALDELVLIIENNKDLGLKSNGQYVYEGKCGITGDWTVQGASGTSEATTARVTVRDNDSLTVAIPLPEYRFGTDRDLDVELDGLVMDVTVSSTMSDRNDATVTTDIGADGNVVLGEAVKVTITATSNPAFNGDTVVTVTESNNYQTVNVESEVVNNVDTFEFYPIIWGTYNVSGWQYVTDAT